MFVCILLNKSTLTEIVSPAIFRHSSPFEWSSTVNRLTGSCEMWRTMCSKAIHCLRRTTSGARPKIRKRVRGFCFKNPNSLCLFYFIFLGKCIDSMGSSSSGTLGVSGCHGYGGNQLVRLNLKVYIYICKYRICIIIIGMAQHKFVHFDIFGTKMEWSLDFFMKTLRLTIRPKSCHVLGAVPKYI